MKRTAKQILTVCLVTLSLAAASVASANTVTEFRTAHTRTGKSKSAKSACSNAKKRASLTCRKEYQYNCGQGKRCSKGVETSTTVKQWKQGSDNYCTVEVKLTGSISTR